MALPAFDPYYGGSDTLLKKMKQQATLSGMPPLTEEQLAAYTYGQRKEQSETALAREQMAKNFEIANMQNAINFQRNRQLAKESAGGRTAAGAFSLANLASQAGILKPIGQALVTGAKAVPGLATGAYGGVRDLMYGVNPPAYAASNLYPEGYAMYTPNMFAGATDYSSFFGGQPYMDYGYAITPEWGGYGYDLMGGMGSYGGIDFGLW